MSKWMLPFLAVILCLAAGCGSQPTSEPTAVPTDTPVPAPTTTPSPVPPTATATPTSTATPEPTLPAVPAGMDVDFLDSVHYAARVTNPGVNIRAEAKADSESLAKFECGAVPLTLDAMASGGADGQVWYHVAEGGWIREDVIKVYADMDSAASAAKAADCQGSQNAGDYTPTQSSVWNTTIGPDNMTGTCSTGSILPVYGLVQITPAGETLTWRSQEPAPYTLSRVKLNVYSYSGPTALNDGTVTMTLTFTSATTLQMTHLFVPTADSACQHTHQYNGVFQWFN